MNEVTTNSKMKLSEHFLLGEFTKSNYPEVYNIPSHVAIENMKRVCAVDIRCYGIEQAIRYATILMDYADESKQEFDELFIEKNRYSRYWVHFAVRPKDNRRKISFLNG